MLQKAAAFRDSIDADSTRQRVSSGPFPSPLRCTPSINHGSTKQYAAPDLEVPQAHDTSHDFPSPTHRTRE
ncbi:unnamed protein product [Zymoseptoria tritici ST99CH_3D7]|uniref:Uncharacterized protein n=1 Tax=Zymoseptoria tritici (strain ST99CH_3D7) TaxID=1276538 RepID=A0A1X7S3H8_ZYMT9|nr:unnamed protein product [Zymoseptoria tritici ST99CH_3D7]